MLVTLEKMQEIENSRSSKRQTFENAGVERFQRNELNLTTQKGLKIWHLKNIEGATSGSTFQGVKRPTNPTQHTNAWKAIP